MQGIAALKKEHAGSVFMCEEILRFLKPQTDIDTVAWQGNGSYLRALLHGHCARSVFHQL